MLFLRYNTDEAMSAEFKQKIVDMADKGRSNSLIMTDEKYDEIVAALCRASTTPSSALRPEERVIKRRYKIAVVNGTTVLFRASNNKEVLKASMMFDVIHHYHQKLGHGGRDKMLKELSDKYPTSHDR